MRILSKICLVSVLTIASLYANVTVAQESTNTQTKAQADINSQQELIDLFIAAAKTGQTEVIDEFLKHGFPVDARNKAGYTALMMATYYGHQNIVTTLLKNGADRCLRDNKGNTALMGAIFKLEWSIAKQLRSVDCDAKAAQTGQKKVTEFAKIIGQDAKLQQLMNEK